MENKINCSVTVMLIYKDKIGFIKREKSDSFGDKLIAPGGKIEMSDSSLIIDETPYFSVEAAAKREIEEETGLLLGINGTNRLKYFCSLTLPFNGRIIISMYCVISKKEYNQLNNVVFLSEETILDTDNNEFAPGMKTEALYLFNKLKGENNDTRKTD
jgi:8-oxo-dGTP pyrophosphatase MutT (NUDIX family)